jgi:hypothetical protein
MDPDAMVSMVDATEAEMIANEARERLVRVAASIG